MAEVLNFHKKSYIFQYHISAFSKYLLTHETKYCRLFCYFLLVDLKSVVKLLSNVFLSQQKPYKNSRIPISYSEIWCETKMSRRWNYRSLFCEQRIYFVMFISSELISEVFFRPKENYLKGLYEYLNQSEIIVLKMKLQSSKSELTLAEMSDSSSGLNHAAANPTTYFHSLSSTNPMNGLATDLSDLAIGDRPPPRKIRRRNALTVQDPHYPHVVPPPNR